MIEKAEEGASLEVTSISAGSLFEGSDLKVGMMIQSVNKSTFTSFDQGLALLKEAEGAVTIKVFNPLEVSDDNLALVKWYKDELARFKNYRDRGKKKKTVEVGDRVKASNRSLSSNDKDRVWIVKGIVEGDCELRDDSDKETIYVHIRNCRCIS